MLQVCFGRESKKLVSSSIWVKIGISLKVLFKFFFCSLGNAVEFAVGRTRVCWTMAKLGWAGRACIVCDFWLRDVAPWSWRFIVSATLPLLWWFACFEIIAHAFQECAPELEIYINTQIIASWMWNHSFYIIHSHLLTHATRAPKPSPTLLPFSFFSPHSPPHLPHLPSHTLPFPLPILGILGGDGWLWHLLCSSGII